MFDGRLGEVVPKVRLIKVVSMESARPHTHRYTHAYHRRIYIYIYVYICIYIYIYIYISYSICHTHIHPLHLKLSLGYKKFQNTLALNVRVLAVSQERKDSLVIFAKQ